MRWPLRSQIMFPMACVMLATVVAISVWNAWLAGRQAIDRIQSQLRDISETLAVTSFPLTDSVLKSMRGLSGAEYVVVSRSGEITATSRDDWADMLLPTDLHEDHGEHLRFDRRLTVHGQSYLCAALALRRPFALRQGAVLHVLYPVASYQKAWWEAALPPVGAGLAGLMMMGLFSFVIASRVTRPIHQLCEQVGRIAHGQFVPVTAPARDDEVRDLSLAVSRMSEMLSRYETQVRRNERLRTFGRLGGGIAHQIRNAATGCRLALDLHHRRCPAAQDESLTVACQQLDLMEDFLERFLSLGKYESGPPVPVDLSEIVQHVLPLVQPKARHLGVELAWTPPDVKPLVLSNADGLAQVLVNLLLNAIEAAAAQGASAAADRRDQQVAVCIEPLPSAGCVRVHVWDSGAGPAEHVRETLFEALISEKPDGIGLGLFLARELVEHDGGTISWTRHGQRTCFTVELPAASTE
jgi:signal transduction histidine kinase